MQEFKESDIVYSKYGYGVIIKPAKKKSKPKDVILNNEDPVASSSLSSTQEKNKPIDDLRPIDQKTNEKNINDSNDDENKICTILLRWGGTLHIEEQLLKKKITLNIKTFYGSRNIVKADFDISLTIQQLKTLLLEQYLENPKTIYNLRLIHPMGSIKELNQTNNTLEQYNILDNSNLILLVQTVFSWDTNQKGSEIKLSNNNLTVTKNPDADCQSILGSISINSGRHYWEIKIDHFIDEEDLFIGIARKNIDLYARPMDTKVFWGYMCLCAKKFGPDGLIQDYGYQAKKGDIIGVLLEYKSQIATLSFYRNGTKCGVAFSNLTGSFYPIVCINYGDAQITLDPKAPMPLSQIIKNKKIGNEEGMDRSYY